MAAETPQYKIIRRKQLEEKLVCSRSFIYGKLTYNPNRPNEYDPTFPKPIPLSDGGRAVGWLDHEVDAWIAAQAAKRNAVQEGQP